MLKSSDYESGAPTYRLGFSGCFRIPRPWIERQLYKADRCDDPDVLLKHFLRLASEERAPDENKSASEGDALMGRCLAGVLPICNEAVDQDGESPTTKIGDALRKYTQAEREKDVYQPFVDMCMAALERLRDVKIEGMRPVSEVAITIEVNSSTAAREDHGYYDFDEPEPRVPNVVICYERADRSMDAWKDVLSVVEFTRNEKIDGPPARYDVASVVAEQSCDVPSIPSGLSTPVESMQSGGSGQARELKRKAESEQERGSSKNARLASPEVKVKKKRVREFVPRRGQTVLFAAAMLPANIAVNYIFNFTVCNDLIWVTMLDHQGIIAVKKFNFVQDLPRFMLLLYAIQRFDMKDWGRVEGFRELENGNTAVVVPDKHGNPINMELSHPNKAPQVALRGRGTEVVDVISADLEKMKDELAGTREMVAKIYWGEETRESETTILKAVERIAETNEDIKGHVPVLILSHKFQVSTSDLRIALGIPRKDAEKDSRTLYLLVFLKLLPIWTLLSNPQELTDVWGQCLVCHYGLWKRNIRHRDVSAGNLMYYRRDGKVIGVLNDFDLASLAESEQKFDNERTGTIPFMAIELLNKKWQKVAEHRYRHEIESFIWVLIWVTCQCSKPDSTLRTEFLDELMKIDADRCSSHKSYFIFSYTQIPEDVDEHLRHLSQDLINYLRKKFNRRSELHMKTMRSSYELETMQDSDPAYSQLKVKVAEMKAELERESVDDEFRDFAKLIGLEDIEGKVERAANGTPAEVDSTVNPLL